MTASYIARTEPFKDFRMHKKGRGSGQNVANLGLMKIFLILPKWEMRDG